MKMHQENISNSSMSDAFFIDNNFQCKNCFLKKIKIYIYTLPVRIRHHLFFDDCFDCLNLNSVSDEICTLNNVEAIKLIIKISLE